MNLNDYETPTEKKVMDLLLEGYQTKEMANAVNRSLKTVKGHITNLLFKYKAESRLKLIVMMRDGKTKRLPMVKNESGLFFRKQKTPITESNPYGLTYAEQKVKGLMADNRCNQEIAEELCVSLKTVKFHVSNIYKKYGKRVDLGRHHKFDPANQKKKEQPVSIVSYEKMRRQMIEEERRSWKKKKEEVIPDLVAGK